MAYAPRGARGLNAVRAMHGNIHRVVDADLILERLKHAKDVACVLTPKSSAAEPALSMFSLSLPSPDAEKPPPEVLLLPSVGDTDEASNTDTESIADTASVVVEGDIVLAQYSHDKMWYRARVTQVVESEDSEMGSPSIGIFFIDYGNSEITTLQKIRNIQKRFLKLPAFAHECSLFDIVPVDEVVNNLGSALEVDLSRPESERMCTDDRPVSVRDSLVFLEMAVFNTGSQLTSSMGMICAAQYSKDGNWYRARVTGLPGGRRVEVQFVDYGPKPNTMEGALYAINIDNNSLCCLNAELVKNGFARSTGPWSQVDNFEGITLKASSPSGTSTVSPVKKADGPRKTPKNRSPVKNEAAASQASQLEPTKRLSKPDDLSVAVSISAFQSPADFHIQLKEKESDLKKLMEQLKVYEAAAPIQRDWKVGEYCAAKSAEDGRWFRARLCYVGDDGVCEVQMVDYGFLEVLPLSALQTLKKKHVSHECFAERCHLADLLPAGSTDRTKWSQTGIEFVVKQLKGKELFVKLEGETVEGFGLPVDLLIEETIPETPFDPPRHEYMSLKQMLLEKGLALPARRGKSVSSPTTVSQPKADPFRTKVVMVAVSASEEDEEKVGEQHGIVNNMVAIFQPDLHVAPHPAPVSTVLILVPVYVDHDGTIYAHDITEEESNSAFFERIDHYVRTEAPEGHLEVKIGQICLAHFAVDNVWYRARVLEVEPEAVKVKYIDFGNSAVVLRSQLKLANPELCRTPQLAYQLVLHNMKPVYLQRSPPDPNETMSEDELRDLATERENLNEFVQLMDDLNNLPPQTPALGEVPASGEMCSAKYSADNRWYRGLVAKAYPATKTALIFYVDYGNSEVVPLQRLRVLPARFQDTPAQAVRAYLNVGLPEGRKRWTLDDFTAMADTIYLMRHAALIKNTDPLTVELYSEVPHSDSATLSYQQLINSGTILRAAGQCWSRLLK
nr:hypothetical protein BaRGS_001903 [Batillaria attramentaria]